MGFLYSIPRFWSRITYIPAVCKWGQICITNKEIQPEIYITLLSPQLTPPSPLPRRSSSVSSFYTSCNVFLLPTICFSSRLLASTSPLLYILHCLAKFFFTWPSHRPFSELQFWCPCWYHIFPIFLYGQIIVMIAVPTLFEHFYF